MGNGNIRRCADEHLMKNIYFVTEGKTDQIVLQGLIEDWLEGGDFVPRHIQPPTSAFAEGLSQNLSEGWRGVLDWAAGKRVGPAGRDEALQQADCLVIHIDADVAFDSNFKNPPFQGACPPATPQCDWVRSEVVRLLGGAIPSNVVLCVPAQDLETWVLTALHPDISDQNAPIECKGAPGTLLVQRNPYRLVRSKEGRLRKDPTKYLSNLSSIVKGWINCTSGAPPRCPEAIRFESETKAIL